MEPREAEKIAAMRIKLKINRLLEELELCRGPKCEVCIVISFMIADFDARLTKIANH